MQLLQECPLKLTRLEFCIKASTPVTLIYYIEKMQIVNVQKYPKAAVNMQIKFPYCPLDSRGNMPEIGVFSVILTATFPDSNLH